MIHRGDKIISVPEKNWLAGLNALKLLTELNIFLKGDQEDVPKHLQKFLRKDKKGTIDVKIWCVLCTENHTLHLNINKKDDVTRQLCQHSTFQYSRIK